LLPSAASLHVWSPACTDCLPHSVAEEVAAGAGRVPLFGVVQLMIKNVALCFVQGILPSFELSAAYLAHECIYIYI